MEMRTRAPSFVYFNIVRPSFPGGFLFQNLFLLRGRVGRCRTPSPFLWQLSLLCEGGGEAVAGNGAKSQLRFDRYEIVGRGAARQGNKRARDRAC